MPKFLSEGKLQKSELRGVAQPVRAVSLELDHVAWRQTTEARVVQGSRRNRLQGELAADTLLMAGILEGFSL